MKKNNSGIKFALAITTVITVSTTLVACSSNPNNTKSTKPIKTMTVKNDGDVAVPSNYRSWPKFVSTIDKKTGQVREIYINKTGMTTKRGDAFPTGTVSVMELWASKKAAAGGAIRGADGRLIKSKLSKIFVMEKGAGWGEKQPKGTINNGDWLYGAYLADAKTPATKDFSGCRSCHLPLADKDYIARYDQHFDTYKK